jgi:hypothetical protein
VSIRVQLWFLLSLLMTDKLLLHPSDQPVFRLLVDVRACVCEVRFHEVPVWSNRDGMAARAMLAVNEWLFSGDNAITLHLSAPPGVDGEPNTAAVLPAAAAITATLLYKKNRAPWLAMQEVHAWSYRHGEDFQTFQQDQAAQQFAIQPEPAAEEKTPAAPETPALLHPGQSSSLTPEPVKLDWLPGGTGLRGGFSLTLPPVWPACPWARALDLSAMPGLDYTVSRLTRSVADSLQRRDWAALRRLFADRRASLQAAYYLNDAAADECLAFPALLQDQTAKVVSPDAQQIRAQLCSGGKLIRAVGETGAPAVTIISPAQGCQAELETLWMNNGQEWRLAR